MSTVGPSWRSEYKYRINSIQSRILMMRAEGIMLRDSHVNSNGSYLIHTLYFDDPDDSCLWENLSGTDPRSKIRLRYYNSDSDRIFLERKTKVRGMCLKHSCELSRGECEQILSGRIPTINDSMSLIKKELLLEITLRCLYPKVIVTYKRIPYVYSGGHVRITFDSNLSSSNDINMFLSGEYIKRPVLPTGQSIMEAKWDEVLPLHIKDSLRIEELKWTAFSKYYMCRKYHL